MRSDSCLPGCVVGQTSDGSCLLCFRWLGGLQFVAQQFGLESYADELLPKVVVQVVGNALLLASAGVEHLALCQGALRHRQLQARGLPLNRSLQAVPLSPE